MDESELVRTLHDEGRYKEALVVGKRVLRLVPGHAGTLLCVSSCHSALGHGRRALRYARRAVAAAPFDIGIRVWLAEVYAWREDRRRSLKTLEEALALDPESLYTHRKCVELQLELGLTARAAETARDALRLDPHDRRLLDLLAQALTKLGRHEDAAAVTRSALSQDPEHPPSHARLGWIQITGGSGGDAVAHFREALRLDPHDSDAQKGLLEALRARFFLYRWPLQLVFWVESRPRWIRFLLLVGGFLIFSLLVNLHVHAGSRLALALAPAPFVWLIVILGGHRLVRPFIDLVLRFDPKSARLMKRERLLRVDILASLAVLFLAPLLDLGAGGAAVLIVTLLAAAPLWHAVTWPALPGRRTVRIAAAMVLLVPLATLGITAMTDPRLRGLSFVGLFLAWVLFFALAERSAKRDGI